MSISQSSLLLPIEHLGPSSVSGEGSLAITEAVAADLPEPKPTGEAAPMIPPEVDLGKNGRLRLSMYLRDQIRTARSERYEQMDAFARWREKYKTKFPTWSKDWPIANSSQLVMPVIKTAVDTMSSRLFQTVMAAEPMLSVRTKNKEYQDFAVLYEEFLDLYAKEKLDIEDKLDTAVTESINLGTAVLEVTTKRERRSIAKFDPMAQKYTREITDIYNGPCMYHFPIEDFWIRVGYPDLQKAPWCGKLLRLTWSEIKDMALAGELDPERIQKIWDFGPKETEENAGTLKHREIERQEPMDWEQFKVFELSVRWATDTSGADAELIVMFHEDSGEILRVKYNTFKNARRPWIVLRFKRNPHSFYGEGLAEMLEHLQEEISTIHNQRIDNATMANLQIILVRRLIKGLSPGDRLWTGKIVKVQDVNQDVGTLRLGETYPNTVNNENISRMIARELSGIGEAATGQAQPVSRTTATAQLSLLEELNRRFDKTVKGYRKSIREIGLHVNDLFAEFGTYGLSEQWLGERAELLETTLNDPRTFAYGNVSIQVTSTKSTINREVEFQSAIAVMNLVISMGQQMMGLAQQLAPQMTGIIAHELVKALKGPFRKVMQYSDSSNVDEATSVLAVLERILPKPEDFGGMAAAEQAENAATANAGRGPGGGAGQQGGGGQPGEAEGESGMGALVQALAARQPGNGRVGGGR